MRLDMGQERSFCLSLAPPDGAQLYRATDAARRAPAGRVVIRQPSLNIYIRIKVQMRFIGHGEIGDFPLPRAESGRFRPSKAGFRGRTARPGGRLGAEGIAALRRRPCRGGGAAGRRRPVRVLRPPPGATFETQHLRALWPGRRRSPLRALPAPAGHLVPRLPGNRRLVDSSPAAFGPLRAELR